MISSCQGHRDKPYSPAHHGGTGFIGRCLLDQLVGLPHEFAVVVVSRTVRALPIGQQLVWDLTTLAPEVDVCAVPINAATPVSPELNSRSPADMFWTNVRAMENVVLPGSFASLPKIVSTSCGGVYGEIPGGIDRFPKVLEVRHRVSAFGLLMQRGTARRSSC